MAIFIYFSGLIKSTYKNHITRNETLKLMCESIPRKVGEKSRVPKAEKGDQGPPGGVRGPRLSRRRKGQMFLSTLLCLSQNNNESCSRICFSLRRTFWLILLPQDVCRGSGSDESLFKALLRLAGGHPPSPFSCLCPKLSRSFLTLIKLCYTNALEWSSLVPGPEAQSSSLETMTPASFTRSYQPLVSLMRLEGFTIFKHSTYLLSNNHGKMDWKLDWFAWSGQWAQRRRRLVILQLGGSLGETVLGCSNANWIRYKLNLNKAG